MIDPRDADAVAIEAMRIGQKRRWSVDLSKDDRADIVQDVIVKYVHRLNAGEVPDKPQAWLETAIRNQELDFLGSAAHKKRAKDADAEEDDELGNFLRSRIVPTSLQPVRDGYLAYLKETIGAADWDLLWSRFVDRVPVKDIAARMGLEPDTVSQRLRRARTRAKLVVEEAIKENPDLDPKLDQAHPNVYNVGKRRAAKGKKQRGE